MAYPVAAGYQSLTQTWIPILYAKRILPEFYARFILNYCSNRDYEGEIKTKGDTVRVRKLTEIDFHEHVDGQKLEYQKLDPGYIDLHIDRGLYWGFNIPDVTDFQTDIDLKSPHTTKAAIGLRNNLQRIVFADIPSEASEYNRGRTAGYIHGAYDLGVAGTPREVTAEDVVDLILDCGAALDEVERPEEDRFIIIPIWMHRLIKGSEIREVYITGDAKSSLRTGNVGMIDRFNVFATNTLPVATDGSDRCTSVLFGDKYALTFAGQIDKTEQGRFDDMFGGYHRALFTWGHKVIDPLGLGHAYVCPASE